MIPDQEIPQALQILSAQAGTDSTLLEINHLSDLNLNLATPSTEVVVVEVVQTILFQEEPATAIVDQTLLAEEALVETHSQATQIQIRVKIDFNRILGVRTRFLNLQVHFDQTQLVEVLILFQNLVLLRIILLVATLVTVQEVLFNQILQVPTILLNPQVLQISFKVHPAAIHFQNQLQILLVVALCQHKQAHITETK